ncbi:iron-sulfur cluster co-chaperone protein HscB homolog [Humulus lupulus]|uniref:iron-sulfur cluster co-chaperone protein HscB homolog n=1 Tax=Humulus lupulus TaxID=3486 RepID=UPI002B40D543|nr:iron-sulfur cluster co-chaperone protein HscB homolog [Humulus lupulus]XP_062112371.1 iron-sulfur cluster co-chaperone protein HscB homolog [Humulus lupulus]XP_062112372.1 iron-sulfur cluster co-chaperone protein HscB homolog [Humulus lupulus]
MTRQNLRNLLSSTAVLRRTLSPNPNFQLYLAAKCPSSSSFCPPSPPTFLENHRLFPSPGLDFLGRRISGKIFISSQSVPDVHAKCWNCNAKAEAAPFLVCQSCRCIQPMDHSVDYFQIYGLEKKYDIEDHNLERKYKDWQKQLHPDLVHSKSEKEKEYAADQSARVIDAYRTLSKPLSRAIYVLKLEGVNVDEEETISELDLLAEIMEIRESVEEAADSQALNKIRSEMQEKLKHLSILFANAYHNRNFGEAVNTIRRMRYYERVIEEIVRRL